MKSLAAEAVEPPRSQSVPDASGCDITKPNPADSRLDSVLERMRMDWHEAARYKITLSKDGDWTDKTVVAEWLGVVESQGEKGRQTGCLSDGDFLAGADIGQQKLGTRLQLVGFKQLAQDSNAAFLVRHVSEKDREVVGAKACRQFSPIVRGRSPGGLERRPQGA